MSELEFLDRTLSSTAIASEVIFAGEPCGTWRINTSGSGKAAFHLVLRGSPWLHVPDSASGPRQLSEGDFAFLPRDAAHVLSDSPDPPASTESVVDAIAPAGSTAGHTALICGKIGFEPYAKRFLLAPLPEVIVMPGSGQGTPAIVAAIVSSMWQEVRGNDKPLLMTLNKLADVLIAQVLRYSVSQGVVSSGVFAGLSDTHVRRALLELMNAPGESWTVAALAQKALMSRSAFAARFQAVVGRAPLDFLRDFRMQQAVGLLRSGRSVADVAASLGYDSEASFAKAFKRVIGVGPGAVRPH